MAGPSFPAIFSRAFGKEDIVEYFEPERSVYRVQAFDRIKTEANTLVISVPPSLERALIQPMFLSIMKLFV